MDNSISPHVAYPHHLWPEKTKSCHLTIQDILDLEPGETVKYLCLDRNTVWDLSLSTKYNQPNKFYRAKEFYQNGYTMTYTKGSDPNSIEGTLVFRSGGFVGDPQKYFDIEYKPNHWLPFINGHVEPCHGCSKHNKEVEDKIWSPNTRIGWRGPMIRFSDLKKLPKIYWDDSEE